MSASTGTGTQEPRVSKGLLVRLEAQPDKDEEVERFLASALPLVRAEEGTTAWFGIRFGRHEYGIFDVFPDERSRVAHLNGPVAGALRAKGGELFRGAPEITELDVVADKLSDSGEIHKGLLLTWEPREGHEEDVAEFLRGARSIVEEEPRTIDWFAIRLADGSYGIFDVFPDNGARFAHLTGRVPRELAKHARSLIGAMPDMDMLDVLAAKPAATV